MKKRQYVFAGLATVSLSLVFLHDIVTAGEDSAVTRTRHQVEMLDTLYKTAIVLITDKYVTDPSKFSGASAAKMLFDTMDQNGYHEVRLVGLTEVLVNPGVNAPKDDFEKAAKEKILAGEATHEDVVTLEGKRYLRKATAVPVVLERCVMCHGNFAGNEGAIGSLMYTVPLIE